MLPAGTYTSINADRKAVLSQSFCLCSRQSQRFLFSVGIRISMRKYFTQYLNDKLQTSLPVCYLAIHLTQNTLPQKMTQIKIQISLWNLICRKCSKVTVLTGCFSGLLVSPFPTSSMPSTGKLTQKCKKLSGWRIRSQLSFEIQTISGMWSIQIDRIICTKYVFLFLLVEFWLSSLLIYLWSKFVPRLYKKSKKQLKEACALRHTGIAS